MAEVLISNYPKPIDYQQLKLAEASHPLNKLTHILIILETAIPKNKIARLTYNLYTKFIMPVIGFIFSKKFYAYNYLSKSAEVFPYGKSFNNILKKNGFIDVEDSPQTLGVASNYFAKKT